MPAVVDKHAKRLKILRAAAGVFARKGYHATRMVEIAQQAAMGKATLYEYFAAKEDVFYALLDHWLGEFEQRLCERLRQSADPLEQADIVRRSAVEFYRKHARHAPIFLEFWAHALRSPDRRFLQRVRRFQRFLRQIGARVTHELVRQGVFLPVDVASVVELEAGISDGIFVAWVLSGRRFRLDRAYVFRQSVLGLGLLSEAARAQMQEWLRRKLEEGFLPRRSSARQRGKR